MKYYKNSKKSRIIASIIVIVILVSMVFTMIVASVL